MPYHLTDTSWSDQESRTQNYVAWLTQAEHNIRANRRAQVEAQIVLQQEARFFQNTRPTTRVARLVKLDALLSDL